MSFIFQQFLDTSPMFSLKGALKHDMLDIHLSIFFGGGIS